MDKVKEKEKEEVNFIKQQQALYKASNEDFQKVKPLNSENRGALFERAIERKRNHYQDDDEEYRQRLEEKQNQVKSQEQQEEFTPIKHSLATFIQGKVEEQEPTKTSEPENENVEEPDTNPSPPEAPEIPEVLSPPIVDNREQEERIHRVSKFEQMKNKVAAYEDDKKIAIQKFKDEILLEVEDIKKRRAEFLAMANTM